jgi:hypothetical protein
MKSTRHAGAIIWLVAWVLYGKMIKPMLEANNGGRDDDRGCPDNYGGAGVHMHDGGGVPCGEGISEVKNEIIRKNCTSDG